MLTMGATDIGTGSDTVLGQIAAEVLGVPLEDIVIYSSDTDFTPFAVGAYASSTTYISGGAVRNAALKVKKQIQEFAAKMLEVEDPDSLVLRDRKVIAPDGRSVSLHDVGMTSTHQLDQHQIMATASHISYVSPPPTAATFAEVTVDTFTGQVTVDHFFVAADIGRVVNPITAAGQVEGGVVQAMGFVMMEDMTFDAEGRLVNARLRDYHPPLAHEAPPIDVVFVETNEENGPFGAKSVAELAMDGAAPSIVNAVHNATGVWVRELPLYPERVWRALQQR
jgi:putative selenate reductase molybdopterin-binding subunit